MALHNEIYKHLLGAIVHMYNNVIFLSYINIEKYVFPSIFYYWRSPHTHHCILNPTTTFHIWICEVHFLLDWEYVRCAKGEIKFLSRMNLFRMATYSFLSITQYDGIVQEANMFVYFKNASMSSGILIRMENYIWKFISSEIFLIRFPSTYRMVQLM